MCTIQPTARWASGRLTQHPQVPPAGAFSPGWRLQRRVGPALGGLLGLGGQGCGIADRIGKRKEVIGAGLLGRAGHGQAKDFPAPGNRQGVSVLLAQVVAVWFGVRGQWTKDSGGIRVDVRQGSNRRLAACRS